MEYGSDEHLDGLSRNALKTEVRWWHDRANEMEGECERLQAENDKLRELVRDMWRGAMQRMDYAERYAFADEFVGRMRERGVEVDG